MEYYDMTTTNAAVIKAVRAALQGEGKANQVFNATAPKDSTAFEAWYKSLREDADKLEDGKAINNRLGVYAYRLRKANGWTAAAPRAEGAGRKSKAKDDNAKPGKPVDVTPDVGKYRLMAAALMAYRLKIPAGPERDAIDAGIITAIKGK